MCRAFACQGTLIFTTVDATVSLSTALLAGNVADHSGGAFWLSECELTLANRSRITNNSAAYGGGVTQLGARGMTLGDADLDGNKAQVDGGALFVDLTPDNNLSVLSATIRPGNLAILGGAVAFVRPLYLHMGVLHAFGQLATTYSKRPTLT